MEVWAHARSRATRLAVLAFAASLAVLAVPSGASAHDSQWCDHTQLSGKYWKLVYAGFHNEPPSSGTGGAQARRHWHYVDHHYRPVANQGSFTFDHQRKPVCGYVNSSSAGATEPGVHLPGGPVDPADLPRTQIVLIEQTALTTFTGGAPVYDAVTVGSAPLDACLISVTEHYDADTGEQISGYRAEYARPDVASAIGHGCTV